MCKDLLVKAPLYIWIYIGLNGIVYRASFCKTFAAIAIDRGTNADFRLLLSHAASMAQCLRQWPT